MQSCASTELLLLVQVFHLHSTAQMGGKSPGTRIWECGWLGVSNQPSLLGDVEKGKGMERRDSQPNPGPAKGARTCPQPTQDN